MLIGVYLEGGGGGHYHVAGRGVMAMAVPKEAAVDAMVSDTDADTDDADSTEEEDELEEGDNAIVELEFESRSGSSVDAGKDGEEDDYPHCATCMNVLKRIKHGTGNQFGIAYGARAWFLPTICNVMHKTDPETYGPVSQSTH